MHPFHPAWRYSGRGAIDPATSAGYTGPGDIVGSALAWWGFRAYSAATIGANAVRIVRASDSTQQDFVTLANGNIDAASIATFLAATTGKIVTLYDQTGNGRHVTQATDGLRPSYTASAVGGFPAATFDAALGTFLQSSGSLTQSQPFTFSALFKNTLNNAASAPRAVMGTTGDAVYLRSNNFSPATTVAIGAGADVTAAGVTDVAQAVQGVFNGASSAVYLKGGTTNGDASTGGISSALIVGKDAFEADHTGYIGEAGIWGSAFNGTQAASMLSNQNTYWGL